MVHELVLRNFVRSPGLTSQTLRPTNIELWGGKGTVQSQGSTFNAQILVLRTFVRRLSSIIGSSMDCPCAAQSLLDNIQTDNARWVHVTTEMTQMHTCVFEPCARQR